MPATMEATKRAKLPRAEDFRKADHPIESLFVRRWSPRAMSGEPISDEQMRTLFEAARWAPSTYNEQEWRFLYSAARYVNVAAAF
jgi:nitroreductase